ncbi:hypothetical protein MPSEU_000473000 [Mayamaea pseudoterrestris]|nr:hypothetical protein MPSEU_000473000 [Mayamaea pseudoterrestris]
MDDPSGLSLFGTQQEHATNGAIGGCNGASIDASAALVDCSKERLDIDKLSLLKRKTDESVEGLPAGVRHKCNKRQKKEAATESWSVMYDRLVNFKQMYGDTLVPKRFAQDPKLGTWVETQRVQYRHLSRVIDQQTGKEIAIPSTRLSAERLEKLQAIDFAWTAKNVVRKRVADAMNEGNGRSPSAVTGMTKRPTGSFTGVSCKANDESQWYELFDLLVEYKQTYGHCLVPRKYDACPRLAAWVEQQRRAVATLTKSASASAALNQVSDFSPEKFATPPLAFDSTNHLGAVGDVEIYLGAISSEHDSPKIINDKTSAFTCVDKTLSSEKKAKLDALGFVWSLRSKRVDDHWETMFQQLLDYRQMYGDCLVPSRWEKNPKLGKWIETQRYEHTKLQRSSAEITEGTDGGVTFKASTPRLTEERIRRLESVGFEWRVKQKMKRYYQRQWDVMFDRLLLFKKQTGHTCVPKRYPPDTKLGTWMHTQRIQWKKQVGKVDGASSDSADDLNKRSTDEDMSFRLTDERRRRLEEIGFVWSAREGDSTGDEGRAARNSYDEQWDGMFTRLKAYYDIYGHTMVPKRYKGKRH